MSGRRATSWTGSEAQRREQGVCLPPSRPRNKTPRYLVPAGCPCEVQRVAVDSLPWGPFTTTRETGFERYESYRDRHYVFRHDGWFLRVHRRFVVHREDTYA